MLPFTGLLVLRYPPQNEVNLPRDCLHNDVGHMLCNGQQHLACLRLFFVERTTLIAFLGSSLQLLLFPILLFLNWELVSLFINVGLPNPFSRVFLLSGYVQSSRPNDPRYQKSWWDLLFLAYYIVLFAFIRQFVFIYIARPLAKYFGLRRLAKIDRFGEQTYAFIYYAVFGAWGYVCSLHVYSFSILTPNSV